MNSLRALDWPAAVAAVGSALAEERWPKRVRSWLATEARSDEPWCVALSGGADSVAVLLTLCRWRTADCGLRIDRSAELQPASLDVAEAQRREPKHRATAEPETRNAAPTNGPRLLALHFNHRLRGAAADGDEVFCRELCAALGVELQVGTAEWPAGSEVSEAQAREARFAFLDRAMRATGARALWLGHQRDDVVETLLLRLSRGSGARGLAAPRPVQGLADGMVRLRPLLDVPKTEIVAALRGSAVPWREDESNHGETYFRNRLRHSVVPAWAAAAPADLAAAVARSRALLEEEDEALEQWVDRVLPTSLGDELPLAELRAVPVAVTRRALHRWLGTLELGGVLSSAAFDELLATVRAGCALRRSVGCHGFLEADADALRLVADVDEAPSAPEWGGTELAVPGEVMLPDGGRLRAVRVSLDSEFRRRICAGELDDRRTAFVTALETDGAFSIRGWRAGDRNRPLGAPGVTKLQDQFVNRRIPRQLRRHLPVVCTRGGAIIWVPGLSPAHEVRLLEGTMVAVQLTYTPANSLSEPTGHV